MESEAFIGYQPSMTDRVRAAAGPVLCIAISYVDPGKWAASVEGGARFGFDLSLIVVGINCAAMLCHYLCARVVIATGKNLTQICREEYDDLTCLLLGIQSEISMIVLDLTMVLGMAYGLHAIFGIDLLISVFLTICDAALFPFLARFLENPKAKIASIFLACFILVSYGTGILISQPESSLIAGGMLTKLTGENAYTLMSVLGANIMPHNFYLHSSIVQRDQLPTNVSKWTLCHDHFFATLCIFSGIFLVNCMLMNLAASVYYGSGLISLTLQDALSLMDQVFRSSLASIALIFIMFFSNQLVAVTWSLGKQMTVHDFFRLEIPVWLHCATIKLIAIVTALFCILHSGSEGIFQLLIFTQVVVALLLPSSIIPLFRVASSRSIMGAYRISHLVEFLALFSFVGVLGIMLVFFTELLFGTSDWVISLKWNIGTSVPISYLILLIASFASLVSMLWLAITPLKSANSGDDTQALRWERRSAVTGSSIDKDPVRISERIRLEKLSKNQESKKSFGNYQNLPTPPSELKLPDTLLDSVTNFHLATIQENKTEVSFPIPDAGKPEELENVSDLAVPESDEIVKNELPDDVDSSTESKETVKKTLKIDEDAESVKDEGESCQPKESTKDVPETPPSSTSEGQGLYTSIKGKNDEVGSGTGSLSRLAGLGRAARRQLAAILDEFWGQLFDYHGQPMPEARSRKLDVLIGIEPKPYLAPIKLESVNNDSTNYLPSAAGRGSDLLRNPSFYGPPLQHISQDSIGSNLGIQPWSAMWSNQMQVLDALDSSERRFRSMHVPSSSIGHDQQPATFHGYDLAAYVARLAKEKGSDYGKFRMESLGQSPPPLIISNPIDPYAQVQGPKPQNGIRTLKPPGFHNVPVARNSSMKSERAFPKLSPEPIDYSNNNSPNVKKFHSLPDISGLYVPQRDSSSDNNSQWRNNLIGYGPLVYRPACEQMGSGASTWTNSASGFQEIPTPKVCRDAFSLQFGSGSGSAGSFYSRQPYEQFGVADKSPPKSEKPALPVDMEAKLLESLRICVMKLLKLEGSDWLFRQDEGVDEDLIDRVAARERFLLEVETRTEDVNLSSGVKIDEIDDSKFVSIPNCGEGCVWHVDLVVSFGIWGIHRILELSLMESRPELWGKYTYVLNRLQGIIDLAFSKPRSPMSPCFCLHLQKSSSPVPNGSLPPPAKMKRGKFTTAAMLLDMTKDVEIAISCRKGRTGTASGDVAFPKGKENLASVLKRYRRRLANKSAGGSQEPRLLKT